METAQNGKGRGPEKGRNWKNWSRGYDFLEKAKKLEIKQKGKSK